MVPDLATVWEGFVKCGIGIKATVIWKARNDNSNAILT